MVMGRKSRAWAELIALWRNCWGVGLSIIYGMEFGP
jgi:hypothetical protein